jgi:MYXO-CTERM domain-containing protein
MSIVRIESRSVVPSRSRAARSSPVWVFAFSALHLAWGTSAAAASAPEAPRCNPECPKGTTCEFIGTPCPAIFCEDPDDALCRCDTRPVSSCVPASCQTDSDCADNMTCFERIDFSNCPVPAPAPTTSREPTAPQAKSSERAAAPAAEECTTTTVKECILRSQLPCATATDCGTGFTCEQGQTCSAPAAPSGGYGSSNPPPVSCMPDGHSACQLIEMACDGNADCPADFVCLELNGSSCSLSSDGETRCEPNGPPKQCIPRLNVVPNGVLSDSSAGNATHATLATGEFPANEEARASAGGHCSVGYARAASTAGLAGMSVLGLAMAFGWRRRRV